MESFVRRFIRSSVVWLAIGVLLGVTMGFFPARISMLRTAHLHANVLGFVSMMIFGVAYHVLPRFSGRPLHAPALAAAHLVLANTGLALQTVGWIAGGYAGTGALLLRAGAVFSATGALFFVHNVWQTLGSGVIQLTRPTATSLHHGASK